MGLTDEQIAALRSKETTKQKAKTPHQHTEYRSAQKGPLRFYERSMPCANHEGYRGSGCGSPTYCKVEHEPLCMMHALRRLNELVIMMDERLASRGSHAAQSIQQGEQESLSIYEAAIRKQEGDERILRDVEQIRHREVTSSESQLGLF
jgi:hypothetical protein